MPRVIQKGQVTIPQEIRSVMGIKTGDEIIFEIYNENVVLKKKSGFFKNFKKYVGFLSHLKGKKPDAIIKQIRGRRELSF